MTGNSAQHESPKARILPLEPYQIEQLIFKVEELKAQGLLNSTTSQFIFQGKRLTEGLSFSQRFRHKALELCQSELNSGKLCVLVEHSDHITIWQEEQVDKEGNMAQVISTSQAQSGEK